MKKILLFILILLFLPTLSFSTTIIGKVVSVADGDTITILNGSHRTKIRLYGIDTPEKAQAFGKQAKKFTASLTSGKQVSVKVYDTDRYGRSVGVVFVSGTNVNQEIIRNGYAWQYRKYCKASFCSDWSRLEQNARRDRRGLWADNSPQAPWKWRKNKRSGGNSKVQGGIGIYHGNVKSKTLHSSTCQYYNCKNCTKVFGSVQDALNAGYHTHKGCVK
jgi:endonuclease YncB( thermonuclease family)